MGIREQALALIRAHIAALFFSVAVFAPAMWWLLDRDAPYERLGGHITPAEPHPGDPITINWDVNTTRHCKPASTRNVRATIVDSVGHENIYEPVPGGEYPLLELGRGTLSRRIQLPHSIAAGPAKYRSIACYFCNPMQEWLRWPTCVGSNPDSFIPFTIAPPQEKTP